MTESSRSPRCRRYPRMRTHYCARGSRTALSSLSSLPPLPYRCYVVHARGHVAGVELTAAATSAVLRLGVLSAVAAGVACALRSRQYPSHAERGGARGWAHEANVKMPGSSSLPCRRAALVPEIYLSSLRILSISLPRYPLAISLYIRTTSPLRVTRRQNSWIHSADNTHATVSASLSFSRLSIALSPLSLTLLTLFVAPVAYRLFSCTRVETDAGSLRRSFDRYDEIAPHDRSHVTGYGSRVNTYEILDTP